MKRLKKKVINTKPGLAREKRERLDGLCKHFEMNPEGLLKIQAVCRGRIQRQAYLDQLRKYKSKEQVFTKVE